MADEKLAEYMMDDHVYHVAKDGTPKWKAPSWNDAKSCAEAKDALSSILKRLANDIAKKMDETTRKALERSSVVKKVTFEEKEACVCDGCDEAVWYVTRKYDDGSDMVWFGVVGDYLEEHNCPFEDDDDDTKCGRF